MQLDQMRGWLKALVVLVALAAGFPVAAWAHGGHQHGAPRASAHVISPHVAVTPAERATDSRHSRLLEQLTPQGFVVPVASPLWGKRIVHAAKSVGGIPPSRAGSQLHPIPADEPIAPAGQNTCCCGGLACHAGMATPTLTVTEPWTFAAKVELPPVLALAGAVAGGIERPPRGSSAL